MEITKKQLFASLCRNLGADVVVNREGICHFRPGAVVLVTRDWMDQADQINGPAERHTTRYRASAVCEGRFSVGLRGRRDAVADDACFRYLQREIGKLSLGCTLHDTLVGGGRILMFEVVLSPERAALVRALQPAYTAALERAIATEALRCLEAGGRPHDRELLTLAQRAGIELELQPRRGWAMHSPGLDLSTRDRTLAYLAAKLRPAIGEEPHARAQP